MLSVQTKLFPVETQRWVRKRDNSNWSRSRRSMFHRLLSGMRKARLLHKQIWHIVLTTSMECLEIVDGLGENCREVFKRDFSVFVKRCRRMFGRFEYMAVHTEEGQGTYHIIVNSLSIGQRFSYGGFRGFKALWYFLSEAWFDIHFSFIVYSRLLRGLRKPLNYILSHYLGSQKGFLRFHWSWRWVFVGFVRRWLQLCRDCRYDFKVILVKWRRLIWEKSLKVSLPQSLLCSP